MSLTTFFESLNSMRDEMRTGMAKVSTQVTTIIIIISLYLIIIIITPRNSL
jgi:hypothetical protein